MDYLTVHRLSLRNDFIFVSDSFFHFQFSKSFSSFSYVSSLLLSTPIYPTIGLFLGESASLSSFFSVCRHYHPLYFDCTLSRGTPSNINVIYTLLKSTFSAQQFCCWQYGSVFIPLVVAASQICKITQNSEKIRTYSSSRSSKVTDLDANRKRTCNFLLVISSNFGCISYRFRDIDA